MSLEKLIKERSKTFASNLSAAAATALKEEERCAEEGLPVKDKKLHEALFVTLHKLHKQKEMEFGRG